MPNGNGSHDRDFRADSGPGEALGQSESFLAFQESLSRVAQVNRPVLIIGERGTGKELAASRLHFLSGRWQEPFVALNCAALPATLIESELFGHEAGAFTGATGRRLGRFEAADEGTLFLDEIGNIPLVAQEKILRVVEYSAFERVGGSTPMEVDVRIVAATNADLPGLVRAGKFKADLLDRLSFEVLYLPPLRERPEDIMLLANHFAARMAYELGREAVPEFSAQAEAALSQYRWPGNVRELKNVVERAVYRAEANIISSIAFDPFRSPHDTSPGEKQRPDKAPAQGTVEPRPLKQAVQDLEVTLLREALESSRFNQKEAADMLGLTYHQFRGLYRKYEDNFRDD